MEYRKLPHGKYGEELSVLGLGLGGIQKSSDAEIEAVIRKAINHGVNFFDLCGGGKNVYAPFGRAIAGQREKVHFQLHFGAVYNDKGEYGWSRDLGQIKETLAWELDTLGTDYIDFGFLHCVDELCDYEDLQNLGIVDFVEELKEKGVVRYMGFSSHSPETAHAILDDGFADMMMFSINPAYDYETGRDDLGLGSTDERTGLFRRCQAEGVGISVMKPFYAGKLLTEGDSPFHIALSHYQCLQYALDRPGVLACVPGVRNMADLDALLGFAKATAEERDYSILAAVSPDQVMGSCVYCRHCQPCPVGIDIGLANKYYDLALAGDEMAADHYSKLAVKASDCVGCGHCDSRCPFQVKQSQRMKKIAEYFKN